MPWPAAEPVTRLDRASTIRVNAAVRRAGPLDRVVGLLAKRLAAVEIGLMGLLLVGGRAGSVTRMLLAVGCVYAASEALGTAWRRKRPFVVLHDVIALVEHDGERSFPSRHTAAAVAMATVGYRAQPRLGVAMLVVGLLLGVSRIAAGVHYPSDVAAGAVLGATIGALLRGRSLAKGDARSAL